MKLRYGAPEEAGMSPQRVVHLARLAEGWVKDGTHPALVVLAARRGVIVLHEAFGTLTPAPDAPPVARDTIFPLASLSKPITATCVMQLLEDGLLGLNRPVQDYIPEFEGAGKEAVMVHHLLTHTSGLNEMELDSYVAKTTGITPALLEEAATLPPLAEYLTQRYGAPLWKPPGEEMSYCNMNYMLLGEIVRRVSGRPLAEFAQERIFAPLGMTDTHYILPAASLGRVVQRPPGAPFPFLDSPDFLTSGYAAGSVTSTALDLAVFGQMFLNGGVYGGVRVLSPATAREMTRNQIPGIGSHFFDEYFPEACWGYGWSAGSAGRGRYHGMLASPERFCHGGAGQMFLWGDPVYDLVGVYLSVAVELHGEWPKWSTDLFAAAVTAAVMDG
jgi:CubicO group peptidase (beta-lactamase class C family)